MDRLPQLETGARGPVTSEIFPPPSSVVVNVPPAESAKPARIPFSLPSAIADFIKERDAIWHRVKAQLDESGEPNLRDLGLLKVANDAARQMISLTPGPNTPVLDPLRARVEDLLCRCCDLFLWRLDYENPDARLLFESLGSPAAYGG